MSANSKRVVWIASYPKSGNTWLRFLACNLAFGRVDSAATLNRLAPDLHELRTLPEAETQRLFLKTHFMFSPRLPLVECSAAAVYVVRDPADVMLSNFHYAQRSGASAPASVSAWTHYVDDYIRAGGDSRWIRAGMGTWEENVRSWLAAQRQLPVLRIRYEDVLADAPASARALCEFIGLSRTPQEIATAVAESSFERMRAIEEADIRSQRVGIFYKPYLQQSIASGLRFMRSGKSGEAARVLSADQQQRFDRVFGSLRRELGYA